MHREGLIDTSSEARSSYNTPEIKNNMALFVAVDSGDLEKVKSLLANYEYPKDKLSINLISALEEGKRSISDVLA